MKKTNKYVAWNYFHGDKVARYQGIAESLDEFKQMCEEKNFDLSDIDEIECIKEDIKDPIGRPYPKGVSQDY